MFIVITLLPALNNLHVFVSDYVGKFDLIGNTKKKKKKKNNDERKELSGNKELKEGTDTSISSSFLYRNIDYNLHNDLVYY